MFPNITDATWDVLSVLKTNKDTSAEDLGRILSISSRMVRKTYCPTARGRSDSTSRQQQNRLLEGYHLTGNYHVNSRILSFYAANKIAAKIPNPSAASFPHHLSSVN